MTFNYSPNFNLRKRRYFEIKSNFFKPLISILDKLLKKKSIFLSFYYPSNYEVNTIKLFDLIKKRRKIKSLLPIINSKDRIQFIKWTFLDTLKVNKYGMLEPILKKKIYYTRRNFSASFSI